ncbi:uncharacterized protein [Hemitrygon akajei]|uniref:uncharacterized protein isoform X1 n=1 Tax=Hemitrygon akajei TaxID=2704970 RepID=UPI003BF94F99
MLPVYLLIASLVIGADSSESHCLGSDVLCTTADYQLRRYKESVWVGTHVDVSISPKVDTFMQLLISYTRGENSAGLRIQSNGQFLISFTGDGEITMYLLVPEELWENPPTPTSPQAFITRFPTMDVLSRRIRWNAMTQANDFNRTLTEQNAKFNNSFFFMSFCKGKVRRSIHGHEMDFAMQGSGGRATTASPRASRRGRKHRCRASSSQGRCQKPSNTYLNPFAGVAVFQLEGADEHTTTAPPMPTRLDRADEHTTTAPPVPTRLDRADEHTTTAPPMPTRLDRADEHTTTAPPMPTRLDRKSRCRTSSSQRRCKKPSVGQFSPLVGMAVFQLEGAEENTTTAPPVPTRLDRLSKRSIRTPAGAFTSGGRSFWGTEVSMGGVSYDFSSMPAGNEVWFVATGEMDCPLM